MDNILIYTPIYPPQRGGASSYFSTLIAHLSTDYDIYVITRFDGWNSLVESDDGVPIYRVIPNISSLPLVLRTAIPSFICLIITSYIILSNNINIVHSHSTSNAVPGLAVATILFNISLVYDCRDEDFPRWLITLGNTERWLSCSSNIDRKLVDCGVEKSKIKRIPVVNPEYVSDIDCSLQTNKYEVVYVGSIAEFKGVFLLLEAFNKLRPKIDDMILTIIGGGSKAEELQEQINRSTYTGDIRYLGSVSHRTSLSEIASADVLVLPSEQEGMPRVIVEAFELGTPVIATPVGDVCEVIEDEKTGILIEREPDAIAAALQQLYRDSSMRLKISQNAVSRIDDWDWETVHDRIISVYTDIAD